MTALNEVYYLGGQLLTGGIVENASKVTILKNGDCSSLSFLLLILQICSLLYCSCETFPGLLRNFLFSVFCCELYFHFLIPFLSSPLAFSLLYLLILFNKNYRFGEIPFDVESALYLHHS